MTHPETIKPEPRNWFFTLLVPVSALFVLTAVALAVIPVLEQRAIQAGVEPPSSAFRDALRRDGWIWLLVQLGVVIVLAIAAMVWDNVRQKAS